MSRIAQVPGTRGSLKWIQRAVGAATLDAPLCSMLAAERIEWLSPLAADDFAEYRDGEMDGPASQAEWEAAYRVMHHVMGLGGRHKLARHVLHLYPDIRSLA